MSLWDAVTGKVWSWNKAWNEVEIQVRRGLATWVSEELVRLPQAASQITGSRDFLFAHFVAGQINLRAMIDTPTDCHSIVGVNLKDRMLALHATGLLALLRSIHSYSVMVAASAHNTDEGKVAWAQIQLEGLGGMYRCPAGYIQDWFDHLDYFADSESGTTRIGIYLYGQVAETLGLPPWHHPASNPVLLLKLASFWMNTGNDIAGTRNDLYQRADWSARVVKDLSAMPTFP